MEKMLMIKIFVIVLRGTTKTSPFKGGMIESPPLKGDLGGCKDFPTDRNEPTDITNK